MQLAILRAVSQLGNDLGMRTTAEGVRTMEQLRDRSCRRMQQRCKDISLARRSLPAISLLLRQAHCSISAA